MLNETKVINPFFSKRHIDVSIDFVDFCSSRNVMFAFFANCGNLSMDAAPLRVAPYFRLAIYLRCKLRVAPYFIL